jgi:excinuclease ABC subunit C
MYFPDQEELFPQVRPAGCIRFEIGTCLGPCTGQVTRSAYAERWHALKQFLDGVDSPLLAGLRQDMATASSVLDFERAARLRDRLQLFDWLHAHLARIRQARDKHTFVYPVQGHQGQDLWYVISQGCVLTAVPAPSERKDKAATLAKLDRFFGRPRLGIEPSQSEGIDGVLLVSAWFRRRPAELQRVIPVSGKR